MPSAWHPIQHWVASWHEGEQPTPEQVEELLDDLAGGQIALEAGLGGVPEERRHGVEIPGTDRIELVIVTAGATDGQANK